MVALVLAGCGGDDDGADKENPAPDAGDGGTQAEGGDASVVGELGDECSGPNECEAMLGACVTASPPLGCGYDDAGATKYFCVDHDYESGDGDPWSTLSDEGKVCSFVCDTQELADTCTTMGGSCHCEGNGCSFQTDPANGTCEPTLPGQNCGMLCSISPLP